MPKPLRLRELKAEMAMKELTLRRVSSLAKIPYAMASELLNGSRVDPVRLNKLSTVIKNVPMPQEVAA